MEEQIEKSIAELVKLEQKPTSKVWNRIAREKGLCSAQTLSFALRKMCGGVVEREQSLTN